MNVKKLVGLIFFTIIALSCNKKTTERKEAAIIDSKETKPTTLINSQMIEKSSRHIPYNALKAKGKTGRNITLATAQSAKYTIVIPNKPTTQEQKAAAELAYWLNQLSGATFTVIPESQYRGQQAMLSIGHTQEYLRLYKNIKNQLKRDGYSIQQNKNNLFFSGGIMRGPLNAVYAFLEEDLGVRWYTRGFKKNKLSSCIVVPATSMLTVIPTIRVSNPAFESREPYTKDAFEPLWSLRNRTSPSWANLVRMGEDVGGIYGYAKRFAGHTFSKYISHKNYFESNPEYFSERKGKRIPKGQLCLTNEEVYKIVLKKAKSVLLENPQAELLSFSQNDGGGLTCMCANCSKVHKEEESKSGTLIRVSNRLIKDLKKDFPKIKLVTFAYKETVTPPKNTKPHKDLIILLCTDIHWGKTFQVINENPKFVNIFKDWEASGATIWIWDYVLGFKEYIKPMANMQVIAENIRYYHRNGVEGVLLQGAFQDLGGAQSAMRSWVWSKLLWDPSRNEYELMKEFTFGYYGEAAPAVWKYNKQLWDQWEQYQNNLTIRSSRKIYNENFKTTSLQFMDEAERLSKKATTQHRVKVAKLSPLYFYLRRGSSSQKDNSEFDKRIEEFQLISEVTKVSRIGQRDEGIDKFIAKAKSNNLSLQIDIPKSGTIVYDDKGLRLAKHDEFTPILVEDELAENKFAIKQPIGLKKWMVWTKLSESRFTLNKKYKVRILVRVEGKINEGKIFKAGVFDNTIKKPRCNMGVRANSLNEKKYTWIDIGEFVFGEKQRFYFSPFVNSDIKAIYIDRIEFIPQ